MISPTAVRDARISGTGDGVKIGDGEGAGDGTGLEVGVGDRGGDDAGLDGSNGKEEGDGDIAEKTEVEICRIGSEAVCCVDAPDPMPAKGFPQNRMIAAIAGKPQTIRRILAYEAVCFTCAGSVEEDS